MAYVLGYRGRHIIIWFLTLILSISWWQCGGFTFIAFVVSILDKLIMKMNIYRIIRFEKEKNLNFLDVKFCLMNWIQMSAIPLYKDLEMFLNLLY